jgi:uncharacterized protein
LYLDVRNIGAEGLAVERTLRLGPLEEVGGETVEVEPVEIVGDIHRLQLGFEFRGRLRTAAMLVCSRCAESFRQELELPFELIYREEPVPDNRLATRFVGPAAEMEDPAISSLEEGRIHLERLAEEQVQLALPLKPLCREDCRGLCPQCGSRRGERECGCRPPLDPRLEALRDLKRRMEEG